MKIVLVGYMGSGKSTVGRALAKRLGVAFVDLDDVIVAGEGKTIAALFETEGQIAFRKKENRYLVSVLASDQQLVLATGGGTPCYGDNMQRILAATPNVFYLKMSINALISRLVHEKAARPLIAHLSDGDMAEFLGKHLFERNPFYLQATHNIDCDGKGVGEVVSEIESRLV